MGQLANRVSRLEERRRPAQGRTRSEETFEDWQLRAEIDRDQKTPRSVKVARAKLAWLRRVGKFSEFESAQQLIQDIMEGPDGSGSMLPPSERSSVLVRREVYFAAWSGHDGMGHLEVPPQWAEMFAAAEEWRQKMLGLPTQVLARWILACRPLVERYADGVDGEIDRVCEEHLARFGITEELLERVTGLGSLGELTSEETGWLIHGPMQDDFCSEWCWAVQEAVRKIDERRR